MAREQLKEYGLVCKLKEVNSNQRNWEQSLRKRPTRLDILLNEVFRLNYEQRLDLFRGVKENFKEYYLNYNPEGKQVRKVLNEFYHYTLELLCENAQESNIVPQETIDLLEDLEIEDIEVNVLDSHILYYLENILINRLEKSKESREQSFNYIVKTIGEYILCVNTEQGHVKKKNPLLSLYLEFFTRERILFTKMGS